MTRSKKALQLLDKQIAKLDEEPFDLEAWKSGAQSLLELLFGDKHSAIGQIKALKVDYSSWALRDATSKYNPLVTCKQMGKALLENAKDEIELLGLPSEKDSNDEPQIAAVKLTSVELKKISKALESKPKDKRQDELIKAMSKWKSERVKEILGHLIASNPGLIS
ncbi:MAG: hypothetical protein AAGC88_05940 [Bacteroidota bacterium]